MKGKHHIVIESPRLKYEFEIKRNLTIIKGDSATGKTTLIDLIRDYHNEGDISPIKIESDVSCEVFSNYTDRWRQSLELIQESIVFIDEGNTFIRTKEFAEVVKGSSNYYVLITRDALPALPYSIREVYGIRTTGKYHFPEQVYHEFYPLYDSENIYDGSGNPGDPYVITEDSQSGFQFFRAASRQAGRCISAEGNSNIYHCLRKMPRDAYVAVIADGAAFGAHIDNVLQYARFTGRVVLYLPESFEWIILRSGVVKAKDLDAVLKHTENFALSELYESWEQFYTDYLIKITEGDRIRQYQKTMLKPYYTEGIIKERILNVMPREFVEFCL